MFHWLIALGSLPAGRVSEFSSRLPSVVLGSLSLLLTFLLSRTFLDYRNSWLAVLILANSALWIRTAIAARVDMTLSFFVLLGVSAFYFFVHNKYSGQKYLWLILIGLSLAALTKSPAFLVLPGATFLIYGIAQRQNLPVLFGWTIGLCGLALVPLVIWYWLAYQQGGQEFLNIIYNENFARFFGSMSDGSDPHEHSIVYLLGTIVVGLAPWSLLAIFLAVKSGWNYRATFNYKTIRQHMHMLPPAVMLALCGLLASVGFFSIPDSKRAEYLLPCYPFAALLLAYSFSFFKPADTTRAVSILTKTLLVICLLIIVITLTLSVLNIDFESNSLTFVKELLQNNFASILMGLTLTALGLIWLNREVTVSKSGSSLLKFAVSYTMLLLVITNTIAIPAAQSLSPAQIPVQALALAGRQPIFILERDYSVLFYLQEIAQPISALDPNNTPTFYLIAHDKEAELLKTQLNDELSSDVLARPYNIEALESYRLEKVRNIFRLFKVSRSS